MKLLSFSYENDEKYYDWVQYENSNEIPKIFKRCGPENDSDSSCNFLEISFLRTKDCKHTFWGFFLDFWLILSVLCLLVIKTYYK